MPPSCRCVSTPHILSQCSVCQNNSLGTVHAVCLWQLEHGIQLLWLRQRGNHCVLILGLIIDVSRDLRGVLLRMNMPFLVNRVSHLSELAGCRVNDSTTRQMQVPGVLPIVLLRFKVNTAYLADTLCTAQPDLCKDRSCVAGSSPVSDMYWR